MSDPSASDSWIHFPLDLPVTLHRGEFDLAATAVELRLRRHGDVLSDLNLVIAAPSTQLAAAGLSTSLPAGEARAQLRFAPELLPSLPTNAATLRRGLGEPGPLTDLGNWAVAGRDGRPP